MRKRDMKVGESYVSLGDGILVLRDLNDDWVTVRNRETNSYEFKRLSAPGDDPLGVHKAKVSAARRGVYAGMLFDFYLFDMLGRKIEDDGPERRVIVPLREIKGTWSDYLTHYVRDIQNVVRMRETKQRYDEADTTYAALINRRLQEDGLTTTDTDVHFTTQGGHVRFVDGELDDHPISGVTIYMNLTRDEFADFLDDVLEADEEGMRTLPFLDMWKPDDEDPPPLYKEDND